MKMATGMLDIIFVLPVFASLTMIADIPNGTIDPASLSPYMRIAILLPSIVILALLAHIGARFDRRCGEDYIFQILANAALISVMVTIMLNMFWGLADQIHPLPELSGQNMAGITILAWCSSYYWYRIRGVKS